MNQDFLNQTFLDNSVESIIRFFSIILIGLVLKKFVSYQLSGLFYRLIKRHTKGVEIRKFQELLSKPVGLFIIFISIYIACKQIHYPVSWELPTEEKFGVRLIIWKIFQLSLVISLTWIILRVVDFFGLVLLERAHKTASRADDQLVPFVKESIKFIVVILSFFFMLAAIFHVNIVSLIAGLGIGGLAIALAAKDTLENLLGSFAIFLDKPFTIGDLIKIGNTTGRVERIGFRSTQIRTFERTVVTVPNKKMMDTELENVSLRSMIRAVFPLLLRFDTPVDKMELFIQKTKDLLNLHEHIEVDPAPLVRLARIGESGIELEVLFFVRTTDADFYVKVKEEILLKILRLAQELTIRFDAKAFELPVKK
jgi:MscS family membrane protein